ncbi:MAG: dienelactone hydrolase family protein [Roseovarius sp.]
MRLLALLFLPLLALISATARAEPVSIPASSTHRGGALALPGDLRLPEGTGPHPAVVLIHGCAGLTPPVVEGLARHARALNAAGFATLVLDSFGPRELAGGTVCQSFDRLADARRYRLRDVEDARAFLDAQPAIDGRNIFLMGQSNGGSVAIRASQRERRSFRAIAAYYPWCGAFLRMGAKAELSTPLIVFGGTADDWVPPDACTTIEAKGAPYAVHVYDSAPHSFDLPIPQQRYLGKLVGYDAEADRDARARMIAFFRSQMGS